MTDFVALDQLLTAAPSADRVVAHVDGQPLPRSRWLQRVGQWRQTLAAAPGEQWALFHPDAFEFSAILFALWSLGRTVWLPANRQPGAMLGLNEHVDGFVGDFGAALAVPVVAQVASGAVEAVEFPALALDRPQLYIFTSGSSGEPQAIAKTIGQLGAELAHLQQLWGASQTPLQVISTVSHQHIYGLLFKVLWPLAAGWPFDGAACEYLEQVQSRKAASPLPVMLVSSPTHLSRLPADIEQGLAGSVTRVFSSGAPLARPASLAAQQRIGCPVYEVYGSSETGGIAWRCQQVGADTAWRALPGVQLCSGEQGCLAVRSAHLSEAGSWYQTSDRVDLNGQGEFFLLGRADRIVKVEGKRVSLDEVERYLSAHSAVSSARVLALDGRRSELAAVLVLSESGKQQLEQHGKKRLNQLLKDHLLDYLERPLLPRRWRYLDALPVNSEGKIQLQTLQDLFMGKTL